MQGVNVQKVVRLLLTMFNSSDAADNMTAKQVRDFASTKTKKLPETVSVSEAQLRGIIRECVKRILRRY